MYIYDIGTNNINKYLLSFFGYPKIINITEIIINTVRLTEYLNEKNPIIKLRQHNNNSIIRHHNSSAQSFSLL